MKKKIVGHILLSDINKKETMKLIWEQDVQSRRETKRVEKLLNMKWIEKWKYYDYKFIATYKLIQTNIIHLLSSNKKNWVRNSIKIIILKTDSILNFISLYYFFDFPKSQPRKLFDQITMRAEDNALKHPYKR